MVCIKCEKKLAALATPDKWKDGSLNVIVGSSGRKLNENKLLSSKAKVAKSMPYQKRCKICKETVNQASAHYCQGCAYKNGICAMCGVQILDTRGYKQSSK
ncbi:hypothetical protein BATDEDRAFT_8669 [Batrachochytrium dendrobatidis JAM81]|uniref:Cysteine-rich PDZ-binding protein n=1 Tax=Batrachochytrium dendrobatidis (strain JAM81 / FGSC 10211) TaxID=684364 RepID=F4NV30_BATDJ|nr:uncharacterized protein BATDEDRAFT_8669 [Batrachochytrium dendrobatidis JAM81]EGF84466.1 hypothetical protein BATDEDRAFT_8669 [Batrachochytrium dendrobatidis JAM81]KAJ8327448.1 hypothetical protein O5D80_004834 [Batrachochytrium dendrobatidis]KAK5665164.1 hypothetical protein QVD99_008012 [Batrachochytrium dendrobatidis]|eukprot:XP_006675035.1 hypothetical protein BATDEDRAFT_8669 [Batrachochytrium dendrobatidis JAM81]